MMKSSQHHEVVAALDFDAMVHTGVGRPRLELDVLGFASELRSNGVTLGYAIRNRSWSPVAYALWAALGIGVSASAVGCNADDALVHNLREAIATYRPRIVIACTNDVALARRMADCAHEHGCEFRLYVRSGHASPKLSKFVDAMIAVDDWLRRPAPPRLN